MATWSSVAGSHEKEIVAVTPACPVHCCFSGHRRRLFLVLGWGPTVSSPGLFGQSGNRKTRRDGDGCSTSRGL